MLVDWYVDADCFGLLGHWNIKDPVYDNSSTRFVVNSDRSTILWVSKLKTDVIVSALLSECVELYNYVRDLLPDRVHDSHKEQEFWMTILYWVGIRLNQFEMFGEHENYLLRWKQCCSRRKQFWMKTMYHVLYQEVSL